MTSGAVPDKAGQPGHDLSGEEQGEERCRRAAATWSIPTRWCEEYGADALRLYEMFMGPLEAVKPWSMDGVSGVRGFLDRVWRMIVDDRAEAMQLNAAVQDVEPTAEQNRMLHKTIKAVTRRPRADVVQHGHRADDGVHELLPQGRACGRGRRWRSSCCCSRPSRRTWPRSFGSAWATTTTLAYEPWPTFDEAAIREDTIEVPVQINGKLRGRIEVPAGADKAAMEAAARGDEKIAECSAARRSSRRSSCRAGW